MAKAVSTLVSITLLVVADRAAEYWNRTHSREISHITPHRVETDNGQFAARPRVIPTNVADTHATLFPL